MSASRKYVAVQSATASKERLMVMLFDRVMQNMQLAIRHLEKKERSAAVRLLGKAAEIVSYLHATLNREAAPRVVDELKELYTFTAARLTRATATGNPGDVREAQRAFAPIAEGFSKAVAAQAQQATSVRP